MLYYAVLSGLEIRQKCVHRQALKLGGVRQLSGIFFFEVFYFESNSVADSRFRWNDKPFRYVLGIISDYHFIYYRRDKPTLLGFSFKTGNAMSISEITRF
jgi:hypothetical protein